MESTKEILNGKYGSSKYKLERDYQKDYDEDIVFKRLANKTKLPTEILMKYTTKLEMCALEHKNCSKCKNILECKNEVEGYALTPEAQDNNIEFAYVPCKYKIKLDEDNKYLENIYYFDIPEDIKKARLKDVNIKDKNRFPVIKWIKEFITNYDKDKHLKGLYLNGNFGCGKTYLLSAMLNELARKGEKVAIIYYPEFLRNLKESFNDSSEYKEKFNYIKKVPLLLLDDIGAESVTEWSRDEVLGTILQYRMEESLPTFFTSNLNMKELEEHLATTSRDVDNVKARRIIERIKQLTEDITMISVNLRK